MSGPQRPCSHAGLHLVDDLAVNRHAAVGIEPELERLRRIGMRTFHLEMNVLVYYNNVKGIFLFAAPSVGRLPHGIWGWDSAMESLY